MADSPDVRPESEPGSLADMVRDAKANLRTSDGRSLSDAVRDAAVDLPKPDTRALAEMLGDKLPKSNTRALADKLREAAGEHLAAELATVSPEARRVALEIANRLEEARPSNIDRRAAAQAAVMPLRRARRGRPAPEVPPVLPYARSLSRPRDPVAEIKRRRAESRAHAATVQAAEEMTAVRALLEEMAARDAAAEAREAAGEAREIAAEKRAERGEKRERWLVMLAVLALIGVPTLSGWPAKAAEFVAGLAGRVL